MGAAFISDLYRPYMDARTGTPKSDQHFVFVGRLAVVSWGIILGLFAVVCIYWQRSENDTLIGFALSVMTFAYAGLIGVFFTAIFTKRGSSRSAIAALVVGFVWMLGAQKFVYNAISDLVAYWLLPPQLRWIDPLTCSPIEYFYAIHITWKLTIGVAISMGVCLLGNQSNDEPANRAAPTAA